VSLANFSFHFSLSVPFAVCLVLAHSSVIHSICVVLARFARQNASRSCRGLSKNRLRRFFGINLAFWLLRAKQKSSCEPIRSAASSHLRLTRSLRSHTRWSATSFLPFALSELRLAHSVQGPSIDLHARSRDHSILLGLLSRTLRVFSSSLSKSLFPLLLLGANLLRRNPSL